MPVVLIVDGSNLLFQMFFGMSARIIGKSGEPIQGLLGFIGALLKLIRMTDATHVIVLFDGEHENERREVYTEYKSNRRDFVDVPDSENPFSQLADIKRALDHMHIRHYETEQGEADDIVAAYTSALRGSCKMFISSQDSDMFQLLTDDVSVVRYAGKSTTVYTPELLRQRLGIEPQQYADYKTLVGDHADNIPGVPMIGPKTAASLLREFSTLEGVIENAGSVKRLAISDFIIDHSELLRDWYSIIKLDDGYPLPFTFDELKCDVGDITTQEVLAAIDAL